MPWSYKLEAILAHGLESQGFRPVIVSPSHDKWRFRYHRLFGVQIVHRFPVRAGGRGRRPGRTGDSTVQGEPVDGDAAEHHVSERGHRADRAVRKAFSTAEQILRNSNSPARRRSPRSRSGFLVDQTEHPRRRDDDRDAASRPRRARGERHLAVRGDLAARASRPGFRWFSTANAQQAKAATR